MVSVDEVVKVLRIEGSIGPVLKSRLVVVLAVLVVDWMVGWSRSDDKTNVSLGSC